MSTREDVLHRAQSWVESAVPHDPAGWWQDQYGCYPTTATGLVAMAWQLNRGVTIEEASRPIDKDGLAGGDVMLRDERHVALFEGWADPDRGSYWGLELRPLLGTVRRRIRYPYENSSRHYHPRERLPGYR
ncbi:hypothetical protein [Actinokineospora diospyrosa]|uniref:NlpC/P60 family protein n=1 Tax=Actinokineospora diospyrosa TaxID=103728 RepID=A0ABT1ID56_9PSEU|nr:hypothetical protein [Actinokineospora diospyrosa]MCP2270560.1 hypothetical protein [Actinokineospora diospyrosa]